jgi:hypothetical protein
LVLNVQPLDQNKRREDRVASEVPVHLGGMQGTSCNVSATGILFEVDASYVPGSSVDFQVELDTPGGRMLMRCHGNIVRIEPRDKKIGVAVKITTSSLEARQ